MEMDEFPKKYIEEWQRRCGNPRSDDPPEIRYRRVNGIPRFHYGILVTAEEVAVAGRRIYEQNYMTLLEGEYAVSLNSFQLTT